MFSNYRKLKIHWYVKELQVRKQVQKLNLKIISSEKSMHTILSSLKILKTIKENVWKPHMSNGLDNMKTII